MLVWYSSTVVPKKKTRQVCTRARTGMFVVGVFVQVPHFSFFFTGRIYPTASNNTSTHLDKVQFRGLAKHSQSIDTRCRSNRKPEAGKAIWYPSEVADRVSYLDRTQNNRLN